MQMSMGLMQRILKDLRITKRLIITAPGGVDNRDKKQVNRKKQIQTSCQQQHQSLNSRDMSLRDTRGQARG